MVSSNPSVSETVLAVDIGATTIKFALVNGDGELVDEVLRRPTPYPCSPTRLVEFVNEEIAASGCHRVGIGFPGALIEGQVIEPGNLSRTNGFTSPIDPHLHEQWLNTDLEKAFREASHQDVRVVNDATLLALGCSSGAGRELVFSLGTGFGIALVVDGTVEPIRDVGNEEFTDGRSYDQLLGDYGRSLDAERWNRLLVRAVSGFVHEFSANTVHLGGGNARHVNRLLFARLEYRVVVNDYDAPLRGAAKLFQS